MATATVRHPATGEESSFEYPDDNTDATIRYEHADGTLGEFVNPNGVQPADPETDDVIWDPAGSKWVPRVTSAEAGSGLDQKAE
jgi:hypothetical protein